MLLAAPASAHVTIRLEIVSPAVDQVVDGVATLEVFAQGTLGGAPSTSFTATVDGDDITGEQPIPIEAGETVRLRMPALDPGPHVVRVTYKPDVDENPVTVAARFDVADESGPGIVATVVGGVGLLLVVVLVFALLRRRSA